MDGRLWSVHEKRLKKEGTKRYNTAVGTARTVPLFRLLSDAEVKEIELAAELRRWEERWNKEKRLWNDKTGKFTVEAIYGGYAGKGIVRLLKEDKSEVLVPLKTLSEQDRRNAASLIQDEKRKAKAKSKSGLKSRVRICNIKHLATSTRMGASAFGYSARVPQRCMFSR